MSLTNQGGLIYVIHLPSVRRAIPDRNLRAVWLPALLTTGDTGSDIDDARGVVYSPLQGRISWYVCATISFATVEEGVLVTI